MKVQAHTFRADARGFINIEPLVYLLCVIIVGALLVGHGFAAAGIAIILLSPLAAWLILALIGWYYARRWRKTHAKEAEPNAPPNGGLAERVDNSNGLKGPPSVS